MRLQHLAVIEAQHHVRVPDVGDQQHAVYFTGLAVVSLPKASSEVRNIRGTQLPDFSPAIRPRRLLNHRERTVITDALGCADVFVAIRQHRLDRFPECRTSATVLPCEPVDSTRQELLET